MEAEFLRYRNEINFPLDSSSRTRALLGQHLLVFPTLRLLISRDHLKSNNGRL
jgi:hypothetical protein